MRQRNPDQYLYGYTLWRRWHKGKIFKAEAALLDVPYFMLVVEVEGEEADHGCGPDCGCFTGNSDERTAAESS